MYDGVDISAVTLKIDIIIIGRRTVSTLFPILIPQMKAHDHLSLSCMNGASAIAKLALTLVATKSGAKMQVRASFTLAILKGQEVG